MSSTWVRRQPLTALRPALAVTAGKVAGRASVLTRRGGGTSLPGLVAERIAPDLASRLAAGLPQGSLVVCGTNGKTTTSALLAALLRADALIPVHNKAGANLLRGVVSALLDHATFTGRLRSSARMIGLFEADEAALPAILHAVRPRVIVVTNLFRDQLDRYGELDGIAARWRRAFATLPAETVLVLNADDPLVASLGEQVRQRVIYYGFNLSGEAPVQRPPENADSVTCQRCGSPLEYSALSYGHIGSYCCRRCGWARPELEVSCTAVEVHGLTGSTLQVQAEGQTLAARVRVPGLYNAYNALAAMAVAVAMNLSLESSAAVLGTVDAAFGRAERVQVAGHDLWLLLVKNPTGCDEVLRLLAGLPQPLSLLAVLNDNAADGTDVSWIWDTSLELLIEHLGHVTFAGTRAQDMALRFKYAGYEVAMETIQQDPMAALDTALATLSTDQPLYAIATYTAMLDLRRGLVARGVLKHYLERS